MGHVISRLSIISLHSPKRKSHHFSKGLKAKRTRFVWEQASNLRKDDAEPSVRKEGRVNAPAGVLSYQRVPLCAPKDAFPAFESISFIPPTTQSSSTLLDTTCHLPSTFIPHRKYDRNLQFRPSVKSMSSRTKGFFEQDQRSKVYILQCTRLPDLMLTSPSRDPAIGTGTRIEQHWPILPTSPRHPSLQSPRPLKQNRS